MQTFINQQFIIRALIYLLAGYYLLFFNPFGLNDLSDKYFQDKLYSISSPNYSTNARDDILILLLNDKSLAALHKQSFFQANEWPILYSDHGGLLATLLKYQPKSLFIDIYFKQQRSTDDSAPRLFSMLERYGSQAEIPILFAGGYPDENYSPFQHAIADKFELVLNGWTQAVGHYPLFLEKQKTAAARLYELTCLASEANAACQNTSQQIPEATKLLSVRWGSKPAPPLITELSTDHCATPSILSYLNPLNLFRDHLSVRCPFHQVLHADDLVYVDRFGSAAQKQQLQQQLNGKTVLYGANFEGLHDEVLSPVHGKLPGVMYHAMALDNLMVDGDDYLKVSDDFSEYFSVLVWAVIALVMAFLVSTQKYSGWRLAAWATSMIGIYAYLMHFIFEYEPVHSSSFVLALLGATAFGDRVMHFPQTFARSISQLWQQLKDLVNYRI